MLVSSVLAGLSTVPDRLLCFSCRSQLVSAFSYGGPELFPLLFFPCAAVVGLDLDRYKYVVQVVIGEQRGEGVR